MKKTLEVGIFTNNVYDVVGILGTWYLAGIIINSKCVNYNKWEIILWPKYHNWGDELPQFWRR